MFAVVENSNLLISLFTVFHWGLTAGLNDVIVFIYISKKQSCCLEAIEFFSEIKSTLERQNQSLNKPVINRQSGFLRSVSRSDLLLMSQHLLPFLLENDFCWHILIMSDTKESINSLNLSGFWTRPEGERKNNRGKRVTILAMQWKIICLYRGRGRTEKEKENSFPSPRAPQEGKG